MTVISNLRSTFGMNCVQCGSELIAPNRSEYLSDSHARHVWHCPKCTCCFDSRVTFSCTKSMNHNVSCDEIELR